MNSLTTNARVDLQNEGYKHIHVSLFSPGPVNTDFMNNIIGPTPAGPPEFDLSSGQSIDDIALLVGGIVLHPETNADVYSRPEYKDLVVGYFSASDVRVVERQAPFAKSE